MDDRPTPPPVLLLTRAEIRGLMRPGDYLAAVEAGFLGTLDATATSPPPLHLAADGGGFHVKAAAFSDGRRYAAFKINGNFPGNTSLPTIQGAIVLCDAADGSLLALMDSIEITLRRTAAASALAARFLASPRASTATLCGCGAQAPAQLEALVEVLPLERVFVFDADPQRAAVFAGAHARSGLEVTAVTELKPATLRSDVVVTCTTSARPFLTLDHVRPGAFVAAVGADAPTKSEIDPELMAAAVVVVDVLEQAAAMGDLHHAIEAGAMALGDVCGDLAGLLAGTIRGKTSETEITLFDSTGSALQDVASAVWAYRAALAAGVGSLVPLGRA